MTAEPWKKTGKVPLLFEDLRHLPSVVDLQTAARALGLGRTKAYELAGRGEFPCRVLKFGDTYRIPTAELLRVLGVEVDQ